jgi:hypothetical protein
MEEDSKIGVACVGRDLDDEIFIIKRLFWPEEMKNEKDKKGVEIGCRSVFLEMIGLLLPLIICPELVANQHVVFKVDNLGCYYGWEGRNVGKDELASMVIRAMSVVGAYLSCYIHVEHLPRMSSSDARLCDRLSRERSTTLEDEKYLKEFENYKVPYPLIGWLKSAERSWDLCNILLEVVKERIEC